MANSSSWTLRETLIVAMLGTVFAVLYLGWVQVWLVAQAAFGSLTMDVVMRSDIEESPHGPLGQRWITPSLAAVATTSVRPVASSLSMRRPT